MVKKVYIRDRCHVETNFLNKNYISGVVPNAFGQFSSAVEKKASGKCAEWQWRGPQEEGQKMTIDEAIAEIEQSGLYGNQVHQETLVLALDALRIQQQREKSVSVDVVAHGRWVDGNGAVYCSCFNEPCHMKYNYCPNCGARMDIWMESAYD